MGLVENPTKKIGGVVESVSQDSTHPISGMLVTPGGVVDDPTNSPQTQSLQPFQNGSISFQYHIYNQQQFNSTVDLKKSEEEEEVIHRADNFGSTPETQEPTGILEEPQPDPIAQAQQAEAQLLDERQNLDDLRRLSVEINETVRAVMKKFKANVPDAIAHIQQRYNNRERFHSITGAFVKACHDGAKPKLFTPVEINPPTAEQMCQLQ